MPSNEGGPTGSRSWPVAVFAYNEQEHIVSCLDSLPPAAPGLPLTVYVLANGCSDATEAVVAEYARSHPQVRLCSIPLGDKSNAWNYFIHELAPQADRYFFIDGDVRACANALVELHQGLLAHGECHAAAAFPVSGRNCAAARKTMQKGSELAGNLYALSGPFVTRVRALQVRLPVGFIGEDGLVAALAKWDLDPRGDLDNGRVLPCPEAGFSFDPLRVTRPRHWALYWNRLIRYRIRAHEFRLLGPVLKAQGLAGVPGHVGELFRGRIETYRPRWTGPDTFFDWLALRRIKRKHCT